MDSALPSGRTPLKPNYSTIPKTTDDPASKNQAKHWGYPPRKIALTAVSGVVIALCCGVIIGRESWKWTTRSVHPTLPIGHLAEASTPVEVLSNPDISYHTDEQGNLVSEYKYRAGYPLHALGAVACPDGLGISRCQCKVEFPSCAGAYAAYVPHFCRCVFYSIAGQCPRSPNHEVVVAATCSK